MEIDGGAALARTRSAEERALRLAAEHDTQTFAEQSARDEFEFQRVEQEIAALEAQPEPEPEPEPEAEAPEEPEGHAEPTSADEFVRACAVGDTATVAQCLQRRAAVSVERCVAGYRAAAGHAQVIGLLCSRAATTLRDELLDAVVWGDAPSAARLLATGADADGRAARASCTPVQLAVALGDPDVVQVFAEAECLAARLSSSAPDLATKPTNKAERLAQQSRRDHLIAEHTIEHATEEVAALPVWQFNLGRLHASTSRYQDFSPAHQAQLNAAVDRPGCVDVVLVEASGGQRRVVDLRAMRQLNSETGTARSVREVWKSERVRFLLKNLHFLLKNLHFLLKNLHFLLNNLHFLLKNLHFLLKNLHFLLKNVDFRLKNVDFLLKNVDFLLKNVDFII